MNLQIIGISIAVTLSFYFAGGETAFLCFSQTRLQAWLKQKKRGSKTVYFLSERPERFLTTILIGNNLANVLYSSLMALVLMEYGFSERTIFIVSPLILLIFGETIPKTIGRQFADPLIVPVAVILRFIRLSLLPIVIIVEKTTRYFQKRLGISETTTQVLSRSDIAAVMVDADNQGLFDPTEKELLRRVIRLGNRKVRDIMTPRTSVTALPLHVSIDEARRLFLSSGFSRLPCYYHTMDNIIGMVSAKDLLSNPPNLVSVIRALPMVPESLSAMRLPGWFRKRSSGLAGVVDEYGGFAGLVSSEDLAEEVVGPILDEYDREEIRCVRMTENIWMVDARMRMTHLSEITGVELPKSRATSVGGFITEIAGAIPSKGAEFTVGSLLFCVTRSDMRGVRQLRLILDDHSANNA
ncbi:MAG: hemolysin family protein [Candidatus Electryoneaceae bacterium]|nr:hemolysin family protein [Candidatus Electryoneaceae bacterium]